MYDLIKTPIFFSASGTNEWYVSPMRTLLVFLGVLAATVLAGPTLPPFNVTVSDENGKVVFKGATNTTGSFTTEKVKAGNYVVQFSSKNDDAKVHQYGLVVSAGSGKLAVNGIEGVRFMGAGVGMRLTVGVPINELLKNNPGLNNPAAIRAMERENRGAKPITGQITLEH